MVACNYGRRLVSTPARGPNIIDILILKEKEPEQPPFRTVEEYEQMMKQKAAQADVIVWQDQSGNGNDLLPGTGSKQAAQAGERDDG